MKKGEEEEWKKEKEQKRKNMRRKCQGERRGKGS